MTGIRSQRSMKIVWVLKKSSFLPNGQNLGEKMSRKLRESFVGHPDTILFLRILREGVFQQPQAISLRTGVVSAIAIQHHQLLILSDIRPLFEDRRHQIMISICRSCYAQLVRLVGVPFGANDLPVLQ
jgi:hypothetical protein